MMEWQPISTYSKRKGETVLRWHKVWKCVVSVNFVPKSRLPENAARNDCNWVTTTRDQSWPESAFTPHWRNPLPPPPKEQPHD